MDGLGLAWPHPDHAASLLREHEAFEAVPVQHYPFQENPNRSPKFILRCAWYHRYRVFVVSGEG